MSTTSRRSFLATTGALLAAAAAAPLEAVRPPRVEDAPAPSAHGTRAAATSPQGAWMNNQPQYKTVALYQFTPEMLQPLVGTNFNAADSQGHRMTLRLLSVNDLHQECPGSQSAFSMRFQLVGGKAAPQGTYQFFSPPLGSFLMFVVPSNRKAKSPTYTAVFNRI